MAEARCCTHRARHSASLVMTGGSKTFNLFFAGVPWTEEEHRLFLLGLQKLGKGDWRGIARNFVTSRTPTQVASHAQKYFIRQSNATRRKRRSSLFDMVPEVIWDPFYNCSMITYVHAYQKEICSCLTQTR